MGRGGGITNLPPRPTPRPPNSAPPTPRDAMEIDSEQSPPNSPNNQTPLNQRRATTNRYKHTFKVLFRAHDSDDEKVQFSRINVLNIVLKSFQEAEPNTCIIIPADANTQERSYTKINPKSKNITENQNIEKLLHHSKDLIFGTIEISSDTIYSTIKKFEVKKGLQDPFNIATNLNNINAKVLVEVGFFVHHLVRHDTVECTNFILSHLPPDIPPFQQELMTMWAGPPNERKVAGVLKIFCEQEHCNNLSRLLQTTFSNPDQSMFISKEYFNTLDPQQKSEYIESQYRYQTKYRSVLVRGVRTIDIPTIVTDKNIPLSIEEWLETIPDLQRRQLFLHSQIVNKHDLELMCLTTNLTVAKKWARFGRTHISRSLNPMQFSSTFIDPDNLNHNADQIEPWNPPPPPTITFMPNPSNAWKKLPPDNKQADKQTNNTKAAPKKKYQKISPQESDNQTITTVNTQVSYNQDTISELQSSYQQHQH